MSKYRMGDVVKFNGSPHLIASYSNDESILVNCETRELVKTGSFYSEIMGVKETLIARIYDYTEQLNLMKKVYSVISHYDGIKVSSSLKTTLLQDLKNQTGYDMEWSIVDSIGILKTNTFNNSMKIVSHFLCMKLQDPEVNLELETLNFELLQKNNKPRMDRVSNQIDWYTKILESPHLVEEEEEVFNKKHSKYYAKFYKKTEKQVCASTGRLLRRIGVKP